VSTIVGLDPSLTSTGLALPSGPQTITSEPCGDLLADRMGRIANISATIVGQVPHGAVVVIEAPALSRNVGQAHLRAGLWWLIAIELADRSCCVVDVKPNVLKKFATGNGNASKADMRMALFQRTGIDNPDDNQVDATWLRYAGLQLMDHHDAITLPKTQLAALDQIHAQLPDFI
jgi:Holliday junction resolvasome RuvABC endonuclease subunit